MGAEKTFEKRRGLVVIHFDLSIFDFGWGMRILGAVAETFRKGGA